MFEHLFGKPTTGGTAWGNFRGFRQSWKEASFAQRFAYASTFTLELGCLGMGFYEKYGQHSDKWAVFFFCLTIIFGLIPVRHGKKVKAP